MDCLSDLIDRRIGHARRQGRATFGRFGIDFCARLASGVLGLDGSGPVGGAVAATASDLMIWPGPRRSRVGPHVGVMVVMVPEMEMKGSEVEAKCRGWQRRENHGSECCNPGNRANLSHVIWH
jgi:hypothetical protein